jgi:hypothetical protein
MISYMDAHCTIGIIPLELTAVTEVQDDVEMSVDINDI